MKKLLTLTAVGACLVAPAVAVQKCIPAFNNTTLYSSVFAGNGPTGKREFSMHYSPTAPDSFSISGIAACSSQQAPTATDMVVSSLPMESGDYCWCKFVSPAVSKWFAASQTALTDCVNNCANTCVGGFKTNRNALTAAFGGSLWEGFTLGGN